MFDSFIQCVNLLVYDLFLNKINAKKHKLNLAAQLIFNYAYAFLFFFLIYGQAATLTGSTATTSGVTREPESGLLTPPACE